MRKLITVTLMLFFVILSAGNAEVLAQIEQIKSQPDKYYFGSGEGKQRKETDQKALQELMSTIYIVISSEVNSSVGEVNGAIDEKFEKVLQTYTYGRLPNVAQISYKTGPIFHIFRYIKKSEYQKIFENKKTEIHGFLREAEENLLSNQLGKSFRNYYRAAVAIAGLQYGSIEHNGKIYTSDIIFARIKEIANAIEITQISNEYKYETRTIVLDICYNEKPVNDINLFYYDLHDYIPLKSNSNLIQIEMWGREYEKMKNLSVKIDVKENLYNSYSAETEILSKLFSSEQLEIFKEITLKKKPSQKINKSISTEFNIVFNNCANCPIESEIAKNTVSLFEMLNNELIDDETIFCDASIAERMKRVVDDNHTKLLSYPQEVEINKTSNGWETRQFGVSVSCEGFPSRNETVVIDFDENGKIYNFCYTINPALHEIFETQGTAIGDWDYRQVAIKFLENYKTSYTTKNISDIETLYSDDAIIITGKISKKIKLEKGIPTDFNEEEITYFKKTKKEHLESQKSVFAANKFVWLQFDSFNINAAPIDSVYGVSMKQNYYSSNYQDEGHLFLLIDFRGEKPLIHVRNWQPQEWEISKQMKLSNFRFY